MLSAASSKTRINLGPFSTSLRGGALLVGGFALAAQKLTPAVLSAGEAVASLAGGGGAAGGVGLLALGQGAAVAKLGLGGLTDALGGSEQAAKNLTPELRDVFNTLHDEQTKLQQLAQRGLIPGLTSGIGSALKNAPVLERIVASTSRTLGGLAQSGGRALGGQQWGRDLASIGKTNVVILDNLGHAAGNVANAIRDIAVEAGPLAEWLSQMARDGTDNAEAWVAQARAGGDLRRFFQGAREDLQLLGSAIGHGGHGIINLFGADDVDGTRTLQALDRVLGRFDRWSSSPAVQKSVGDAIVAEIPQAVAAVANSLAEAMPGAAIRSAHIFWDTFWDANTEGKALIAAVTGAKLAGAIRGMTPATPLFVADVTNGKGGFGGWAKRLSPAAAAAAGLARKALPLGAAGVTAAGLSEAGNQIDKRAFNNGAHRAAAEQNRGGWRLFGIPIHRLIEPNFGRPSQPNLSKIGLTSPGAFEPIFPITLNIDGQVAARTTARAKAKRKARER